MWSEADPHQRLSRLFGRVGVACATHRRQRVGPQTQHRDGQATDVAAGHVVQDDRVVSGPDVDLCSPWPLGTVETDQLNVVLRPVRPALGLRAV